LPKSVLVAFRARRNLLSSVNGTNLFSVVRQCDRAGRLLRESLKLTYNKENKNITQVREKYRSTVKLLLKIQKNEI